MIQEWMRAGKVVAALVAAACCASLVHPVPGAAAVRGSCSNRFGGLNEITTSAPGSMVVRLDAAASISAEMPRNADIAIESGEDELVALVVRRIGDASATLVAGRLPRTPVFGQQPLEFVMVPGQPTRERVQLTPGRYELQVMAGGPTRLTFRLDGIRSRRTLCPGFWEDASVGFLTPEVRTPNAFWAGDATAFTSTSLALFAVAASGDSWAVGQYGGCIHQDAIEVPQEIAHAPHCPVASDAVETYFNDALLRLAHRTIFIGVVDGVPAGQQKLSVWLAGVATPLDVEAVRGWIARSSE